MNSCIICDGSENLTPNIACQCVYCVDCLFQWFEEKVNSDSNLQHIPCPNGDCKYKLRFDDINLPDKVQEAKFQKLAFKTYLCRTQDIRPCPNKTCNGFAFLPNERCATDFSCVYCDFTWTDRNYLSISKLLSLKLREIKSEFLTTIIEFIMTSPCPKCETHILKNGGCSHMTCKKCNFYFCWYCKHDLAHHTDRECSQRVFILVLLLIIIILNLLFSANLVQYFIYILWPFYYLFFGLINNAIIIEPIASVFGIGRTIFYLFRYFKTKNNNYKYDVRMSVITTICSSVATIPTYYLLKSLSVTEEFLYNFIILELIIFAAIATLVAIIVSFNKFIYKEWLKYLI